MYLKLKIYLHLSEEIFREKKLYIGLESPLNEKIVEGFLIFIL